MLLIALLSCGLAMFGYQPGYGQEAHGPTIGLSASLQGSQFDILVPVWTSDAFSIAPAVGVLWAQEGGTDLRIGLVPRFFFSKSTFAPYVGARIGALIASPTSGEGATDWLLGLAVGGEYFLDPHFSVGVESELNMTISAEHSGRFGNPGRKNMNTAAAVMATVYF
jgi:hypothetical protein